MPLRPRSKRKIKLRNKRCAKCGKPIGGQIRRCRRCHMPQHKI